MPDGCREVARAIVLVELKAVGAPELVLKVEVAAERDVVEDERRNRDLDRLSIVELLLPFTQGKARNRKSRKVRVRFQIEVRHLVFATRSIGPVSDERTRVLDRPALKQRQTALQKPRLEQGKTRRVEPNRGPVCGKGGDTRLPCRAIVRRAAGFGSACCPLEPQRKADVAKAQEMRR